MGARAQRLVKALSAKPRILGDLRHPARLGDIAKGGKEYFGVRILDGGRKIFGNDCVIVEIIRRFEGSIGLVIVSSG